MLPIYILTLDGMEERRAPLMETLAGLGLSATLHFGVDGRRGLPADQEARIDRKRTERTLFRPMKDGEYACALSHIDLYQRLLNSQSPAAVILEDDALIRSGFAEVVAAYDPDKMAFLLLDHQRSFVRHTDTVILDATHKAHRIVIPPFRTTGYIVSRAGARFMLDNALPIHQPADWPCDIARIPSYAVMPRPVARPEDDDAASVIGGARKQFAGRAARLLQPSYWLRVWRKRTAKKIA